MPRLSDSMEEGTILKWLKSDGDEVARGEELVEIETDKANMTYESDEQGVLKIVAQEGDTLPVGQTIARIGEGGGEERTEPEREDVPSAEDNVPEQERLPAPVATAEREPRPDDGNGRVKASPIARRMAHDLGVELATLEGTGPGGRIVKADVEAAVQNGGKTTEAAPAEEPRARGPQAGRDDRPGQGRDNCRGPHPRSADDRAPDGGVQGDRARVRPHLRGRHGGGGRVPQAAQGRGR